MTRVDSYKDPIECFMMRMMRSEICGFASTIQGYIVISERAGRIAPIERRADTTPTFWLLLSFSLTSAGFEAKGVDAFGLETELTDSRGAAIASWLILASTMRDWVFKR